MIHYYKTITYQRHYCMFSVDCSKKKYLCKYISNYLTLRKSFCEELFGFITGLMTDASVAKLLKHVCDGLNAKKKNKKLCFS